MILTLVSAQPTGVISKYQQEKHLAQDSGGKEYTVWGTWVFDALNTPHEYEAETSSYGTTLKKPLNLERADGSTGAKPTTAPTPPPPASVRPVEAEKPNWDAIAEGKVRHGIVTALIQHEGKFPLTDETKDWIRSVTNFVMGKNES